ncbi:hypothetical protein Sjap_017832 [Stephania japonica]|uniref:Uncharacterized protein n=1 Tax=Stephania japonica TaxID=461633 RepID=A0AAP0I6W0_9MAGN
MLELSPLSSRVFCLLEPSLHLAYHHKVVGVINVSVPISSNALCSSLLQRSLSHTRATTHHRPSPCWPTTGDPKIMVVMAEIERRRVELTQATPDQPVDEMQLYYDALGDCPKGRVYGLGSYCSTKRRFRDSVPAHPRGRVLQRLSEHVLRTATSTAGAAAGEDGFDLSTEEKQHDGDNRDIHERMD